MIMNNPFEMEGNWYKGSLHTHTTGSDGEKSPEELAEHYRSQGYDFLYITDHGKVTDTDGLGSDDFLVLPGAELGASGDEGKRGYHLVALGIREADGLSSAMDAQEVIDGIGEKGGVAVVAHPYWSALTIHDILRLTGYIGIEVYNTSCDYSIGKGHSHVYWDGLLSRGRCVWGVADDDVHWHFNDHRPLDACGGWVMVRAPELTEGSVLDALRNGHFYASNGPMIDEISVGPDSVIAHASDSKTIGFIADASRGESFTSPEGKMLSSAEFRPRGGEQYLRVECTDCDGRTAWSNPLWVEGS